MDVAALIEIYLAAGLAVLPLHTIKGGACTCRRDCGTSAAKHPITRHGKDDATTDPGQVAEWLARYPGCNWGIRPPRGVIVLDVDPRNGGDVALRELEGRHGRLPPTLTARTGSGGRHIWLSYSGPARGRLCRGVDVKTNSGYLVAPPSVHASGGRYEWIDQRPAAYAPRWVVELLNPPVRRYPTRGGQGAIAALVRFVAASVEGERNNRLYWAACRAHERGLDPTPLVEAAVAVGLTQRAAEATVRSARNAAPRAAARRHPATEQFLRPSRKADA